MKNTIKIFYILFFLGIYFLSFRLLFLSNYDSIGHNWDWGFPFNQTLLNRIDYFSNYTWYEMNLGYPSYMTLIHLIPNTLIKISNFFFNIKITILLLFFVVISVSFFSFKKLLDIFVKKNIHNYTPALLYAFSPFLFNDIIGGSWYFWMSYAFCPLYFVFFVKFLKKGMEIDILKALLTAIFILSSPHNFVLINFIILLYLVYILILREVNIKTTFTRYALFASLLLAFNVYWIFPFLYSSNEFAEKVKIGRASCRERV